MSLSNAKTYGVIIAASYAAAAALTFGRGMMSGENPMFRDTGPFRTYARPENGFREMQQPVEPIVPRDHAVLYCFRQQQKLFAGNMRVDRDADGSVYVMTNHAMPDPAQTYDRATLPPSDYRILPLQRQTRLAIGAQMLEACQNMWADVPTENKVTGLVQTLGL